ncbi:MAG: hypothetical protein WD735_03900, partial [Balneolaceae bacterium]
SWNDKIAAAVSSASTYEGISDNALLNVSTELPTLANTSESSRSDGGRQETAVIKSRRAVYL